MRLLNVQKDENQRRLDLQQPHFFPGIFELFYSKNGHTKPETSCEMVLKV